MANLLDWNTLDHKVKAYLDPDIGIDSPQKAFPVLMVSSILDVTDEEAEDSITDGGKDRGVDAVFVDDRDGRNTIHVFQFKYVSSFEKTKNNFPSGEIDKIVSFFEDVLDENKSLEESCNPILWNKIKEIWLALNKPNPSIEVHFCGNMKSMEDNEKVRANNSIGKYKYVNVHHHTLDSIINLFVDRKRAAINDRLTVVDKDYFDRTDGNIRGLICTVEASEIVRMITDPENPMQVLTDIFNDNVRVYLTRNNKINKKIIETALSDNNTLFWYLNNGITITCDSFSYPKGKRAPIIELNRIQIVNGGQTSNALFEAYQSDPNKLDDVLVLVRIIETKSQPISLAIAESTNSQTPIKGRDLRSNDDIQKKLEEAFLSMNVFYDRKFKQHQEQPHAKRIDALTAGQAHLAYGLELPEVAKKDRGRIFADLYDSVFTDELTVDDLHVPFRLLERIERIKKSVQKSIREQSTFDNSTMYLIDGAYHALFAIGQLCDKYGKPRLDYAFAESKIDEAIGILAAIVKAEQEKEVTFSFNRFFKDAKTKTKVAAFIQLKC
ncbi:MAG: AIPR family protein [Syntrophobacteraceae bacterium]|nr:AIPR family protein [Syntrophobacteraceae bacterium]